MDLTRWHIDAWSVRDGLAFTSYRRPGDLRNAERTAFIAVPTLEPIPVGRVSAALWATRANFQDGLFNADGEEIGFGSLAEVKELVRRGYLAGGIGPGPGGAEERPPGSPTKEGPDAAAGALETRLNQADEGLEPKWFVGSKGIGDLQQREYVFGSLVDPNVVGSVFAYLRLFGEAAIATWAAVINGGQRDDATISDFKRWVHALHASSIWNSVEELASIVAREGLWHIVAGDFVGVPGWGFAGSLAAGATDEDVIFRMPCPLRPGWNQHIRRLSDKLLLATSTRDYFDVNPQWPELIPSVFAATMVVAQAKALFFNPYPEARRERLKAALDWLSMQMPQLSLPAAAEAALTDFAWGELSRH